MDLPVTSLIDGGGPRRIVRRRGRSTAEGEVYGASGGPWRVVWGMGPRRNVRRRGRSTAEGEVYGASGGPWRVVWRMGPRRNVRQRVGYTASRTGSTASLEVHDGSGGP